MTKCEIITQEEAFFALAADWQALQMRVGTTPFSRFEAVRIWWETIAKAKGAKLHIVVLKEKERLAALLPLVVCPKKGYRLLRWAGYDVFFGSIVLSETPEQRVLLWRTAQQSTHYDIGDIKYILPGSVEEETLLRFPFARINERDFISHARFEGKTGEEWFESLRKRVRSEDRRHRRSLDRRGDVSCALYRDRAPVSAVQDLLRHKRLWCASKGLLNAAVDSDAFLPALIDNAAKKKELAFLCLTCDGNPVGFCLGFTWGKTVYGYHLAYDTAYAACSPGSLTAIQALRWAADNGYDEFNFMEGREAYKTRYASRQDAISTYLFCRRRWHLPGLLLLAFSRTKLALALRAKLIAYLRRSALVG